MAAVAALGRMPGTPQPDLLVILESLEPLV